MSNTDPVVALLVKEDVVKVVARNYDFLTG